MKILAIDTASDVCGVSILEDNNLICKLDTITGRTHSENLMPMIQEAFQKTGFTLKDMNLIVCDKGPGSFTGIRIGVATVKAFCDSLSIPCVGISSLEVLAYHTKQDGFIASIIDCKNDNCYYSLYELKNGVYEEKIAPTADSIEGTLETLQTYSSISFVGDGAISYSSLIKEKFGKDCILENSSILDSYNLGLAGLNKYMCDKTNASDELLPLYLKKPQAQRQLEEKLNKEFLNG